MDLTIIGDLLTSNTAFVVYGTLGSIALIGFAKRKLGKEKTARGLVVATEVLKKVEDVTDEGTRVDNFLDACIEQFEKSYNRLPKPKELETMKAVKEATVGK